MIQVIEVDITGLISSMPFDKVRMVMAQPYIYIAPDALAPIKATYADPSDALGMIDRTMEVARITSRDNDPTRFTVFPEYSVPGLEGVTKIDTILKSTLWPNSTIVIAGIEGLSCEEYKKLVETRNNNVHLDQLNDDYWVNCAVIWIKGDNGKVNSWVQPKLRPAEAEVKRSKNFFRGNYVYVFKGDHSNGSLFHFTTLICFDWVAKIGDRKAWQHVLENWAQQDKSTRKLTWLFVLQRNEKPAEITWLQQISYFFEQTTAPRIDRSACWIVFANTAGKDKPGKCNAFGQSGLVTKYFDTFSRLEARMTFSRNKSQARDKLKFHCDVLFREMGACIHSFSLINPYYYFAAERQGYEVAEEAFVHSITDARELRARGSKVPASIKWLNDELDEVVLDMSKNPVCNLHHQHWAYADTEKHDKVTVDYLRNLKDNQAEFAINFSCIRKTYDTGETWTDIHPDTWAVDEVQALKHIVKSLTIIRNGLDFEDHKDRKAHARVNILSGDEQQLLEVLAIYGFTYKDCKDRLNKFSTRDSVLMVYPSTDDEPFNRTQGAGSPILVRFTDPSPLNINLRDLWQALESSYSKDDFLTKLLQRVWSA